MVSAALAEMEALFRTMIQRGQSSGEIDPTLDAAETAQGLLALLAGLRVLSRARPDEALMRAVARQAESLLDYERTKEPRRNQ